MAFDLELAIREAGTGTWVLTEPLTWTGTQGDTFIVPAGFVTDFATVPRFLHWLISPYGAYTRAAVLHDWLLVELATWSRHHPLHGRETWDTSRPPANSRDTDGIFRTVMRDLGVPWAKRWIMWAAVRAAALFNPRRAYGRDFHKDAGRVLGMLLLVLATVVIPLAAVAVLIALGFVRVITLLSGGKPVVRKARRGSPAGTP